MANYVLGRTYEVQRQTKHQHQVTWQKYVLAIERAGLEGVSEERLRKICEADANSGYFRYCVRRRWLGQVL